MATISFTAVLWSWAVTAVSFDEAARLLAIEKMLGYTNIESEKGFVFFQKFLKENGILEQLEELGIKDGDTVRMYGHSFDYYK